MKPISDLCHIANQILLLVVRLSPRLLKSNISEKQFCFLRKLTVVGSMGMTDVSKLFEHSTAAATGLVDRLERMGLVERFHDPEDRRKVGVRLTQTGKGESDEILDVFRQLVAERLDEWRLKYRFNDHVVHALTSRMVEDLLLLVKRELTPSRFKASIGQISAMMHIASSTNRLTLTEIANLRGLSGASSTNLADKLQGLGYAEREYGVGADRRSISLKLTSEGIEALRLYRDELKAKVLEMLHREPALARDWGYDAQSVEMALLKMRVPA